MVDIRPVKIYVLKHPDTLESLRLKGKPLSEEHKATK